MRAFVVEDVAAPKGCRCESNCGRVMAPGDVGIGKIIKGFGWIVWHKDCLVSFLEDTPITTYEAIQAAVRAGEDPWELLN